MNPCNRIVFFHTLMLTMMIVGSSSRESMSHQSAIVKSAKYKIKNIMTDKQIESLLRKSLEGLKKVLVSGDKELHIPIMDPYTIKDDLHWKYYNSENTINLTSIYRINSWSGLSNYTIRSVKANMNRLTVSVDLYIPRMTVNGYYVVKGSLLRDLLPIFGRGKHNATAIDLNVTLSMKLSLNHSNIKINQTNCSFSIKTYQVNVENLFGREASPIANDVLFDMIGDVYDKKHYFLNEKVNAIFYDVMEKSIGGLHLHQLFTILEKLRNKVT